MKNDHEAIGLLLGKGDAVTKEICRCLAREGITAVVRQTEEAQPAPPESGNAPRQWSGRPGEDLFFNGWKLLF